MIYFFFKAANIRITTIPTISLPTFHTPVFPRPLSAFSYFLPLSRADGMFHWTHGWWLAPGCQVGYTKWQAARGVPSNAFLQIPCSEEVPWYWTVNHWLIWDYTHRPLWVRSLWERAYHIIVFQARELLQFAAVCLCGQLLLILSTQEWMVPPIVTVTSLPWESLQITPHTNKSTPRMNQHG